METKITETKTLYVGFTNSDCNEGRGMNIPFVLSYNKQTAIRKSKKIYVQGSDGPVEDRTMIKIDKQWYVPVSCVYIEPPTEEDEKEQKRQDKLKSVLDKAKTLGMTDDDIRTIKQSL